MDRPKRVDIRFGYSCNNNCIFCIDKDSRNKYPDMTTNQVKLIIKEAAGKGAEQLTFTGGEPTIRKDIFDLVSYAKSLGFKTIMFTTNARMLSYYPFAKKLTEVGVNKYMISLHAHTNELYAKLTQTGGFDQAVQGIRNIVSLQQKICASFVVNKHNYRILPEYARFLVTIGITSLLQMTYVMPCGGDLRLNSQNIPSLTDATPFIKRTIDLRESIGIAEMIVMDVPFCFLQGYEKHINELNIPHMEIHAANPEHSTDDYNLRRKTNKVKPRQCRTCRHDAVCEGVWPEYAEIYGFEELVPVN
ncbi:MAG: radical SAM protein [Candidatus Woesearchaeota archaeon]